MPTNGSQVLPLGDEHGPTSELGAVVNDPGIVMPWSQFSAQDELETNEKLVFPASIAAYHSMLTDPQVQGLRTGATWPLLRMNWFIRPNGAPDEVVTKISKDLNLPISANGTGDDIDNFNMRRTQNRFKFLDHLESALDAIVYGFEVFEQVGYIGDDGLFHYKKLAPRPPQTITEMKIMKDGGLDWIKQWYTDAPELPVNRLVVYSFQKRGANWHGRSMLRGCYGPWLLKDRAMRVGVMNIQRAGVGTPIAQGAPGASLPELATLEELAKRITAGDRSGGAIPYGATLKMMGVEGSQPDTVGFIHLLNEEMARAFFSMFMQLGQTTAGSRALGQTFVEYHKLVIEYIAQWFCSIFNEHVIEDDIEWNYGPNEEFAPMLGWGWDTKGLDQQNNPDGPAAATKPTTGYEKLSKDGLTNNKTGVTARVVLPEEIMHEMSVPIIMNGGSRNGH